MPPLFQNREVDPTRWLRGDWSTEVPAEALQRAPEFAREFFLRLFGEFPEWQRELAFLRCSAQPEDIYAVRDPRGIG